MNLNGLIVNDLLQKSLFPGKLKANNILDLRYNIIDNIIQLSPSKYLIYEEPNSFQYSQCRIEVEPNKDLYISEVYRLPEEPFKNFSFVKQYKKYFDKTYQSYSIKQKQYTNFYFVLDNKSFIYKRYSFENELITNCSFIIRTNNKEIDTIYVWWDCKDSEVIKSIVDIELINDFLNHTSKPTYIIFYCDPITLKAKAFLAGYKVFITDFGEFAFK